jgi:phage tail protein X
MIDDLTIHHLWVTVEATTPIILPVESGPSIRGALVNALRRHYCPDSTLRPAGSRIEADAGHRAICPVCWLIAMEDASADRGRNVQRPYTIEPPPRRPARIEPGERLSFGVSLIGQAVNLFPYLVLAIPEMGRIGMGRFDRYQGGRGHFVLRAVLAVNPLSGARQPLLHGGTQLQLPANPVEPGQVISVAEALAEQARTAENCIRLRFRTPTRIVDRSRLVHRANFGPFFQRLVERAEGMYRYCVGPTPVAGPASRAELLALADQVETVDDRTEWVEVASGSQRLGRATPVSGYRGDVVYRSQHWPALLPWLIWGQSLHVGKSAVKGDGWFTIDGCPGWPDVDETTGGD